MEIWIIAALCLLPSAIGYYLRWRRARAPSRVSDARMAREPVVTVASAALEGWARVQGAVSASGTRRAPLTGRPCVAYVVEVAHKPLINRPFEPLGREVAGVDFEVRDASGGARVDLSRCELELPLEDVAWAGLLDAPTAEETEILRRVGVWREGEALPRDLVFREGLLSPGEEIEVLGWCTRDGPIAEPTGEGGAALPRKALGAGPEEPLRLRRRG